MRRVVLPFALALLLAPFAVQGMKGFGNSKAPAQPPPPPKPTRPPVVMPEGFQGKEKAVIAGLFPELDTSARATQGVVLREARRWISDGRPMLAVLVDRWTGALCDDPSCGAQPTDLAVLEQKGSSLVVIGRVPSVGHHGGPSDVLFDAERVLTPESKVLAVVEMSTTGEHRDSTLRLFAVREGTLQAVFERRILSGSVPKKGSKPVGCSAVVRSDEFGTPPFKLKVTEHCTATGKDATELWRWDGKTYRLHGPPSDAEQNDAELFNEVDEPTR